MGRKTPPKRNKRNERPSSSPCKGEDETLSDSHFNPIEGRILEGTNAGRDRSLSKRRKTEQQKITTFTSSNDNSRNETLGGNKDIVSDKDDQSASLMTILSRMETGLEDGRKQNSKFSLQLDQILSEIFDIRKENDILRKKIETLEKNHSDLHDDINRLQKELRTEKESRNSLEQYTRKDNIKIINLPGDTDRETSEETETKVVNFIQKQLQLTSFRHDHISVAHRVGKHTPGRNRAIIVRLVNRKVKTDIFKRRRILKQNKINIFISEDLTKINAQRLYQFKHHPGVLSAWSFQGKLYCKLLDLRITTIEDGNVEKIDRMLLETTTSTPHSQRLSRRLAGGATGHDGGRTQDRAVIINKGGSSRPVPSGPSSPSPQSRQHVSTGTAAQRPQSRQHVVTGTIHQERQPVNDPNAQTKTTKTACAYSAVVEHPVGDCGDAHFVTVSTPRQHGQFRRQTDTVPETVTATVSETVSETVPVSHSQPQMSARSDNDLHSSGLEDSMETFEDRPSPSPHSPRTSE